MLFALWDNSVRLGSLSANDIKGAVLYRYSHYQPLLACLTGSYVCTNMEQYDKLHDLTINREDLVEVLKYNMIRGKVCSNLVDKLLIAIPRYCLSVGRTNASMTISELILMFEELSVEEGVITPSLESMIAPFGKNNNFIVYGLLDMEEAKLVDAHLLSLEYLTRAELKTKLNGYVKPIYTSNTGFTKERIKSILRTERATDGKHSR